MPKKKSEKYTIENMPSNPEVAVPLAVEESSEVDFDALNAVAQASRQTEHVEFEEIKSSLAPHVERAKAIAAELRKVKDEVWPLTGRVLEMDTAGLARIGVYREWLDQALDLAKSIREGVSALLKQTLAVEDNVAHLTVADLSPGIRARSIKQAIDHRCDEGTADALRQRFSRLKELMARIEKRAKTPTATVKISIVPVRHEPALPDTEPRHVAEGSNFNPFER